MTPAVKRPLSVFVLGLVVVLSSCQGLTATRAVQYRSLPAAVYRQKMMGGWVGQMAGVSYGSSTEFRYIDRIIPSGEIPQLVEGVANQSFHQDDLYVEMTFVRTLEQYGFEVTPAQAGLDFARTEFPLWHANSAARMNLRSGIAPPDSDHPAFNFHSDDIDYQIEADFAGLISPGLPNAAVQLGEKFGRMINYGDGLYGGQFISCMYSEAFFESDPQKLVEAGLACIPSDSQYAQVVQDVLSSWKENPQDWQKTWQKIQATYQDDPQYRQASYSDVYFDRSFNIDAKINGAYVVLGLLYGGGDPVASMTIAMRAGQDSDCNPASAGGVLSTVMGFNALDEKITKGLNVNKKWDYTPYNLSKLVIVCEKLARENILRSGGRIETDANGEEIFVIPVQKTKPGRLEQSWKPGPIANSIYPREEIQTLKIGSSQLACELPVFAPGWRLSSCAEDTLMGIKEAINGRANVLLIKAGDWMPCTLTRDIQVSAQEKTLQLEVSALERQPWLLVVRANGEEIFRQQNSYSAAEPWKEVRVDLSGYSGKTVRLEVINMADEENSGYGVLSNLSIK